MTETGMTQTVMSKLADQYEAATNTFLEVAEGLTDQELDKAPIGEWSPRQIIHHMAHADAYCLTRIIQVLSEPGTSIRSFSEEALVSSRVLAYSTTPIASSIALFKATRTETLRLLRSLGDEDLVRTCNHSALGEISMEAMVLRFTDHPIGHAQQILDTKSL